MVSDLGPDFKADVATINSIEAVPSILQVVCNVTGMGFAAVARVTEGRWIACSVLDQIDFGLKPGGELKVETTICHEIRQGREGVVIDNVAEDEFYCGHPTPALYGFQSYISMPIIRRDGSFFGTLCAIDPKPHRLRTPGVIGMFKLFAELIAIHIDSIDRLATSEASLLDERKTAEFREQFIAVLGHDLRSPLGSIDAGVKLLQKTPLNAKALELVGLMQHSIDRMARLIADILDFARGRLGGGFMIERTADKPLKPVLQHVASELATSNPGRNPKVDLDFSDPINCDTERVGQLFSNLLANAVTHGAKDKPIRVNATAADGVFKLSVANSGKPIPPAAIKLLFHPFTRGQAQSSSQGLGLGLFIASEIARAHGGMLTVASSPEETRFTFQMPLQ
jgi:signal transduction histidine kinase